MLTTLLESNATRSRQYRYTIASVAAHSALIAGAAIATGAPVLMDPPEPPRAESTIFIAVPDPAPSQSAVGGSQAPTESRSIWKEVTRNLPQLDLSRIPRELPPVGGGIGAILDRVTEDLRGSRGGTGSGTAGGGGGLGSGAHYTFDQVEQAAALRTVVEPPYPAGLRAAGVTGRVVLRLVVDSAGRVDLATVEVRATASDQFTASVRSILPRLRFAPAMLHGRPVAQLVELPFEFSLRR